MRRYIIVFGIILILSIIDLALAAPVLVQEKFQAWLMWWTYPGTRKPRWGSGVMYWSSCGISGPLRGCGESRRSYQAHVRRRATLSGSVPSGSEPSGLSPSGSAPSGSEPSGSTQSGPDHGSTNVVEGPALNSALSTTNIDHPLMEPSSWLSSMSSEYNVFESLSPGRFQESRALPPGWSAASNWDHEAAEVCRPAEYPMAFTETDHELHEPLYTQLARTTTLWRCRTQDRQSRDCQT